jgi:hypothetical protein
MPVSSFGKPIPGNSLTTHKLGERPWERPPELNSIEEVVPYYMKRLANQDVLDDIMVALESGIPLKPLVETLYTSQVMRGIHSLDMGILVAPALTEFLAAVADDYDVKYKYSNRDPKQAKTEKEKARVSLLLQAAIDKAEKPDEGTGLLTEMLNYMENKMPPTEEAMQVAPEEAMPTEAEPVPEAEVPQPTEVQPAGRGLMSRM